MVDENQEEEGDGGIISRDRAQHRQLLREVVGIAGEAEATMSKLVGKLEADPGRLAQGIDFLDIKNGLLAEYNANLAYLVMRKTRGELIEGDKAVERLCYLRTMMEKIRPIEHKLKFQIDKYVNLAETGQVRYINHSCSNQDCNSMKSPLSGLMTQPDSKPTQICSQASLEMRMTVRMMKTRRRARESRKRGRSMWLPRTCQSTLTRTNPRRKFRWLLSR